MPLWDPSNTKSLHKIGVQGQEYPDWESPIYFFQHWMFKYAYFGYLCWISGVYSLTNNVMEYLENMWFSVVDFCINFKLSQKERLPVAIVYVRNSVAWYLFFFGGGYGFLDINLYVYLDPWSDSLFPPAIRGPRDPESKELLLALTGVFELWDLNSRTVVRQRFLDSE